LISFFTLWCPDWTQKAKKLFDTKVESLAAQLLKEKVGHVEADVSEVTNTEMFQQEPKFTLEATLLFYRAVNARLPKVSERAIDVRKVLRERAKNKVNHHRRII
jgi:uncharacterized membrane protein YgaE (UPF0421/DUF939 family)